VQKRLRAGSPLLTGFSQAVSRTRAESDQGRTLERLLDRPS
jgi:hypothetical protein